MGTIDLSRFRIGDGVSSGYSRIDYSTSDVIRSLTAFSEEHFRGILSLEVVKNEGGLVTVSADGLAFFLKLLLCRVYGRAEIKATVECERRAMHITFNLCGTNIDTSHLFKIAELSGFKVDILGDFVIRITAEVKRTNVIKVYAGDGYAFLHHLYEVFFIHK